MGSGSLTSGVKTPGNNHSPPSSIEIKTAKSYASTPQYVFMAWCLVKHRKPRKYKNTVLYFNIIREMLATILFIQLSYRILPKTSGFKYKKNTFLPVLLYWGETWSLIQREKNRLRVFGKRILWRIFGRKGEEVTGDWRRLHNEELQNLYVSPYNIRVIKSRWMEWVGHVARIGEKTNAPTILVGKPERKRPLRKPRSI
jgi:hypothetical protein